MNLYRTLILSGALVLGAGAAAHADSQNIARIQRDIYAAQGQRQSAPVLQEGRASASTSREAVGGTAAENTNVRGGRSSDPFYFQQANSRQNR